MARLQTAQNKSLLPPAHSTALQEGLHTEACIHAYMHKADTHNIHPYGCKHSWACGGAGTFRNTHSFALQHSHDSFFKHITDEALGWKTHCTADTRREPQQNCHQFKWKLIKYFSRAVVIKGSRTSGSRGLQSRSLRGPGLSLQKLNLIGIWAA